MSLKAFRLNEFEAWAGTDLEDAIGVAMTECGLNREEAYDDTYGEELPMEMEIPNDDGGSSNVITILASMEARGQKGPVCFFGKP
jgi:hypothetical protein